MRALTTTVILIAGCAAHPGDDLECVECDNVTELLVGSRCVPIAEVEVCGPDGHAHGSECHCFGGQQPTEINGTDYCLQPACAEPAQVSGPYHAACDNLARYIPESVDAVVDFADFPDAHADLYTQVLVNLPSGQVSYVHFAGRETGHMLVFLDRAGVFGRTLDADEAELASSNLGANPNCSATVPEVWEVAVTNDTGMVQPQVIELQAGTVALVRLLILEEDEEH